VLGAALALALAGGSAGCVRKETHQRTLEELGKVRDDRERAIAELAKSRGELAKITAAMAERDAAAMEADGARADLTSKLGTVEQHNAELGGRLDAASKSLDALRGKNGELTTELATLKNRLDDLKVAQAAAEARAARQRAILDSFRSMIDAGDLDVEVQGGRVLLVLPNDVLFAAGRAEVKGDGRRVLRDVSQRLAQAKDLELQVGGHTDDTPIGTERFPSNWELSTARAVEVVRILEAGGVEARRLSAAGFGEHRPATPNDGDAGRARNRRIEIALVPDLAPVLAPPAAGETEGATLTPDPEGCSG
jgi:chemotaxis protein MotB